jgi:tRNA A37 threonylcarbamoyladenosine modification protein TsaB
MDKMLDSAGIKFSQIDGFAIALGPGSFTSLRVGLATVKAFAMSTGNRWSASQPWISLLAVLIIGGL